MLESRNFIDGVNFTQNDPCIFVTYPGGASGDLLISIIDKHYLKTGCEYYGIDKNGRLHFFTTDYEMIDGQQRYVFNDQWFFDLAESLSNRNLNYSLLDQVIFGCHMWRPKELNYILDTFPNSKIINIIAKDIEGVKLINFLKKLKVNHTISNNINVIDDINYNINESTINHPRVLNIPFGLLFYEKSYYETYDQIINFLGLNGRLICFDYIKYYLSKQHIKVKDLLANYGKKIYYDQN